MDQAEFSQVWLPLWKNFYRAAYSILENAQESEDAVQELYLRLWKSRHTSPKVENPLSWGLVVLRNICIDRLRRVSLHPTEPLSGDIGDGIQNESRHLSSTLSFLREKMESLPPAQKEALRLRVFEGMSYKDMALATGKSEGSLRVLVNSARKTLRAYLSKEEKQ